MTATDARPVRGRTRRGPLLWLVTLLLLSFAAVWVYPFVWVLSASVKGQLEVFTAGLQLLPEAFRWENYARAWVDADFGTYMLNTIIVTAFTVVIVVIRCAMAGYVLACYSFLGRRFVVGVRAARRKAGGDA